MKITELRTGLGRAIDLLALATPLFASVFIMILFANNRGSEFSEVFGTISLLLSISLLGIFNYFRYRELDHAQKKLLDLQENTSAQVRLRVSSSNEVSRTFPSLAAAARRINEILSHAKGEIFVMVPLAGIESIFYTIDMTQLRNALSRGVSGRILLIHPGDDEATLPLSKRATFTELERESLRDAFRARLSTIETAVIVIFTETNFIFSPILSDYGVLESPTFEIATEGALYSNLRRLCERSWETAAPIYLPHKQ